MIFSNEKLLKNAITETNLRRFFNTDRSYEFV